MVPCLGFPERQTLSDFRLSHGLSPWKGAVVPGRSDDISTSPQSLWNLCSRGPSLSCQHNTHRVTWVSSEGTVFSLSEAPPCRCLYPLQHISCKCVSYSIHFREVFISPEELVCFLLSLNHENEKTGHNFSFCIGGQEAPSQI